MTVEQLHRLPGSRRVFELFCSRSEICFRSRNRISDDIRVFLWNDIQKQLNRMDPNAEDRLKSVQIAEIDIESPEQPQRGRAPRTDFGRTVRYFFFCRGVQRC